MRRVLGFGHPDCEDVAQLALLAFTQNLPAFRGECEPSHYASRLAVRAAVRAGRRERALRARFRSLSEVDEPESANLYDGVLAARRARIVHGLLDTIPPEQANALSLRAVLSWSLEEIAAASRSPVNTVRSRLRLAKTALRKRIETDPVLSDQLELPP